MIPLLAALPVASRLTAWEYSKPNLEWLANELTGPTLRPQWQHFWQQVKAAHSLDGANASPMLPHDPLPPLVQRTRLLRASIFDLPPRTFDAATMFFCAELITANTDEFQTAVSAFTGTVRPGGLIAAAFLAGSSGYEVSGRRYPAVAIDSEDIAACLVARVEALEFTPIGIRHPRSAAATAVPSSSPAASPPEQLWPPLPGRGHEFSGIFIANDPNAPCARRGESGHALSETWTVTGIRPAPRQDHT